LGIPTLSIPYTSSPKDELVPVDQFKVTYNRLCPAVKSLEAGKLEVLARGRVPDCDVQADGSFGGVVGVDVLDSTANRCASILGGGWSIVELADLSHHLVFSSVRFEM